MSRSLLLGVILAVLARHGAAADPYAVDAASHLGASGSDAVHGIALASDGTIVVAAVLSGAPAGAPAATLLNGATASSPGAVLRLAADGRSILSLTRVGADVWDLSLGPDDTIHLALGAGGALKLDATAQQVAWSKGGSAHRIDAGSDGEVAVLSGTFANRGSLGTSAGTVTVYAANGSPRGTVNGLHLTQDIAIDAAKDRVVITGYKQYTQVPQLQVPYVLVRGYTGSQVWKAYDFTYSAAQTANRMADTRGERVVVAGNRVYVGFRTDGGNHLVTSPGSPSVQVSFTAAAGPVFPGGGTHSNFANANGASTLTIIGSYALDTGAWQGGAVACSRISAPSDPLYGKMNAYSLSGWGDLAVDQDGRVAFVGGSASGGGTGNTALGLPYSHNPCGSGEYGGGPSLTVLSSDLTQRLACVRLSSAGKPACVAMRRFGSTSAPSIAWGGLWSASGTSTKLYTVSPLQPTPGGGQEGFVGLIGNTPLGNASPLVVQGATATPGVLVLP